MFDLRQDEAEHARLLVRFNRMYEHEHPRPEGRASRAVKLMLGVLVTASVIVSGSHTIPAFLSTVTDRSHWLLVGLIVLSGLAMLEAGMLTFAYLYTRWRGIADRANVIKHMRAGLLLTLGLALGANAHSVLEPHFGASEHWPKFTFVVYTYLAVSAPLLAYIAGEVLGMLSLLDESDNKAALEAWQTARQTAWRVAITAHSRRSGPGRQRADIQVEAPARPALAPHVTALQTGDQTGDQTPGRQTDGPQTDRRQTDNGPAGGPLEQAIAYMQAHPEALELSARRLAELAGVGKDTAIAARRKVKGE